MIIKTAVTNGAKQQDIDKKALLFLSWRDIGHPDHGGAEVLTHQILKRLDQEKFKILHISATFDNGLARQEIDSIEYLRRGNKLSVIWHAMIYYINNSDQVSLVVDQCNTHRFFSFFWVPRRKRLFFIHQLTREIWFYQRPRLVGWLGYIIEPVLLWLQRKDSTVTVSPSTRNDLIRFGFDAEKVAIIPEGINFEPWKRESMPQKLPDSFIFVNRFAPYKGLVDCFHALAVLRESHPDACLKVLGNAQPDYLKRVLYPLLESLNLSYGDKIGFGDAVVFMGFVTEHEKLMQMSVSKALLYPSIREGWGLSVTEAAAVGTPSIVYPAPGTIDAVSLGNAGYLCDSCSVSSLVEKMSQCLNDKSEYLIMQSSAYEFSKNFHFDYSSLAFASCIEEKLLSNDRAD
ncbi:MAG: glycosyltransferase involved in cell wall biosynthesis [Arenicella sp.]|jgi:glycosyltransferase involved in cell wall biosynthesis